jgi:hypothetical protein
MSFFNRPGSLWLLAMPLLLLFASCKEDKKDNPQPANTKTSAVPSALNKDIKTESARSNPSNGGNITYGTETVNVLPPSQQRSNLSTADQQNYSRMVGGNTSTNNLRVSSGFLGWFIDGIAINGVDFSDDPDFDFFDYFVLLMFDDNVYITFYYDADIDDFDWDWGYWYIDSNLEYLAFDLGDPEYEEVWDITSITAVNQQETDITMEIGFVDENNDPITLELLLASYVLN